MDLLRKTCILSYLLLSCLLSHAQGGLWTWVKGANTVNSPGSIGTMGVSGPTDYPEGRYQAANWIDLNGDFWIFGGIDTANNERQDLWRYTPSSNTWTWVHGPLTALGAGVFGTQGMPAPANIPGARAHGVVSWTDHQGRLWMHGGLGYDAYGSYGDLEYPYTAARRYPPPAIRPAAGTNAIPPG